MCRALGVSRAGFYDWRGGSPSARQQEEERLKVAIRAVHAKMRGVYGARRLQPELAEMGFVAGRDRIARLRREMGIRCRQKRKFKATTNSAHALPVAENVLGQIFAPTQPNQVWTGDITYIPTDEGWLYLAALKDVFSCEIVGYAMAARMTTELVSKALFRAVQHHRPASGLIHHTDRGSQYCAKAYSDTLLSKMYELGVTPSRGRPRVSNDNAYSESLFRTLKYCPQWPRVGFADLDAARRWVRDFVRWYNHEHRHSRIRFVTPAQRHQGLDKEVLAKRDDVYQQARLRHPERWSRKTRDWIPVAAVTLNPERVDRPLKMAA